MKRNSATRIISLFLALSLLFSSMTVLSYAFDGIELTSDGTAKEEPEIIGDGDNILLPADAGVTVQFYRTFDDGYEYHDGLTSNMPKAHLFKLVDSGTGNNYLQMTARLAEGETKCADGYIDVYFSKSQSHLDTLVVKLDVIFDSASSPYPTSFIRFRDGDAKTTFRGLELLSTGAKFVATAVKDGYYDATRHTITYKIETTEVDGRYKKVCSAYIDGVYLAEKSITTDNQYMESIRIGFFGGVPENSVAGIDNLLVYNCSSEVADPLNVNIGYTMGNTSDRVPYLNELFMKVGVDMALSCGEKLNGVNLAITENGKTYVPLDVLAKHLGYTMTASGDTVSLTKSGADTVTLTVGSANATVGGKTVSLYQKIASVGGRYSVLYYRDIEKLFDGYYGSYNDMGLIAVSGIEGFATKASDMALVDVMKRFIFESTDANKEQVNVIDKTTFTQKTADHPYILANDDDFEYYRGIYNNPDTNPELYKYINAIVKSAATAYKNYKKETDGVCTGISTVPTMPYNDNINNGYDPNGGRQNNTEDFTIRMQTLAFGYQITGIENYARLAYYYAVALGNWDHWGPAHFLNCADAAGPYAIAYDWLYDAWTGLFGEDAVAEITEMLFTHGVLAGWYAIENVECPWARRKSYLSKEVQDSSHFYKMANNWNAVCSSGMTAAALALAGDTSTIDTSITVKKADLVANTGSDASRYPYAYTYTYPTFQELGDHTGLTTYSDYSYQLFTRIQHTLPLYGLDFYAPDGSYVESPTYWAYSAKNLFSIGAYCDSVFGEDFGLITNCWGLDETCYYALNAQSSDYASWNYSDSSNSLVPSSISTVMFPYVAYELQLPDLAEIRKDMVASGKYSASYLDIFYYSESTGELKLPELQYHMASIDGYVARDSWEPGSTYIAIKGGYNDSAHGQVDSGEFVYHNNGKIWFCDIGTEGYNVSGFGGSIIGYQYYRMNAEGNNTLALSSDPLVYIYDEDGNHVLDSKGNPTTENGTKSCFAGQYSFGTGYMYKTGDNEYGAYALIDQTEVYYNNAISAKRGMLFTNDRKTVVIQDEVKFKNEETVYWIGHTYQDIYVTTGGRCAYMTDGESTIRVTLISSNTDLRFDVLSAYDFVLQDTHRPEYALTHGTGVSESDRSIFKRLVIECENVTALDLAVVIEDVTENETADVGYEYIPMDTWVPTEDGRPSGEVDESIDFDEKYYGYDLSGKLDVFNTRFIDSNMLTVSTRENTTVGDFASVKFPRASFASATLAGDYLVLDMDIYTDSKADGLSLCLMGNGDVIASEALSELLLDDGSWSHITVVATAEVVRFFRDGELVSLYELHSVSFEEVALGILATLDEGGTLSLDNIRARRVSALDTDLTSLIETGNISEWSEYIECGRTNAPVFSFVGENGTQYGYTFSSLSDMDYEGKDITFYSSNEHAPVYIDKACRIIHGELEFRANSPTLSAFTEDGTTEFSTNKVTVYWHIGDSVETSEVLGIVYAEYQGTNENVGKITETVKNGKSIFNATGWSLTEGGALATMEDMLVTSENCHFYLVDDATDYPYFYETSDGVLVAREDASTLFDDIKAGYKRVILNSDIELTGGGNSLKSKAALYLNGYTLRFNETDSTHMFNINGGNLSIYGGGGSIIKTGSGNIFFPQSYKVYGNIETIAYIENVTLESDRVMLDHRTGHIYFKNVVFNMTTADQNALGVQNRTNSFSFEKDAAKVPKVTLDGCTINHYTAKESACAVVVAKNSIVTITGGTHINIPTGTAFKLNNTYNGGTFDYSDMSVMLKNAFINAGELYRLEMVSSDAPTVKFSTKSADIYSGVYATKHSEERKLLFDDIAQKLVIGDGVMSTLNNIPATNIESGCVIARQNDVASPYIITKDYVTVTWAAGDEDITEYWLNGSLPTPDNREVKANLALLNSSVETGKKYTYSAGIVSANTTFTATKFDKFSIGVSLTLEASMKANIFVEKRDDVEVHGFYLDGVEVDYTMTTMNGIEQYKVVTPGVKPTDATTRYEFAVHVTDENGGISPVRIHFSVVDYLDKVLSNGDKYGREAVGLMANILNYIDAAFRFIGHTDTEDYKMVKTILTKHINKVTYSEVGDDTNASIDNIVDALYSLQVLLSDTPRYIFNLNSGYSGKFTLHYTAYGKAVSKTYTVVDGKCDGRSYIELELNAYDFRTDVRIETEGGEGVYNLQAYYNATEGIDGRLTALLNALYAYSEKAQEYKVYSSQ